MYNKIRKKKKEAEGKITTLNLGTIMAFGRHTSTASFLQVQAHLKNDQSINFNTNYEKIKPHIFFAFGLVIIIKYMEKALLDRGPKEFLQVK